MEAQRQRVHVAEGPERDPPDGVLGDLGVERVAQLAEAARQHPGEAIGEQQPDRRGDQKLATGRQRIHRVAQDQGHIDVGRLGGGQQGQRDRHPRAQVRPTGGPEVGQQLPQGAELVADVDVAGIEGGRAHGGLLWSAWEAGRMEVRACAHPDHAAARRRSITPRISCAASGMLLPGP